jgi:hypothetical protein
VEEDGGLLRGGDRPGRDFIADAGLTVITIDTVLGDKLLLKVGTK